MGQMTQPKVSKHWMAQNGNDKAVADSDTQ